jgi:SAM-dependent methyltransferase
MSDPQPFLFEPGEEAKRYAPATERNRDAIVAVLERVLPKTGNILEIASGTGEHAVAFARAFPGLAWQPSDPDPAALASIDAWRAEAGLPNLNAPVQIDAAEQRWDVTHADAILCINMIHISPWVASLGLFAGAARILGPSGILVLYGPYLRAGIATAPSNIDFNASLRERNPEWGLRSVEAVMEQAAKQKLAFIELIEMPANNLMLIFRKTG